MGLGDPPQEPGSGGDPAPGDPAPGGGGEARKHPSTGDAPGKTGAQHWGRGTPDGRFSPSGRDTPEPLPALATSKLMVTGCSPSSSSTAEDTREVRDPPRPTVSTLEPRAGNPGANSLGNRGHSCEDRGLRGPGLQASPGPTLCFAPSGWACTLPQFPHLQRGTVSLPPRSSEVEPCTCGVSPATELAQGLPPATRPPPFLVREPGLQEAQPRVKVAAGGGAHPGRDSGCPRLLWMAAKTGESHKQPSLCPGACLATCEPPPASCGDTWRPPRPC